MLAIDWSHTKGLSTYDGSKYRVEDKGSLLKRLRGNLRVKSISAAKDNPAIVIEEGCPLSLVYDLAEIGYSVGVIDNHATEKYRKEHDIEKTDENDAILIYFLAGNGYKSRILDIDKDYLLMQSLYHQYLKYLKARVGLTNMKKGHERAYGGESTLALKTGILINSPYDPAPYDESIKLLQDKEKSLLKQLTKLIKGRESKIDVNSIYHLNRPEIKGLGDRIWVGILVTANPQNFKNISSYLRFCGLTNDVMVSHRYNRHAKMLYHMLAEQVLKGKDPEFRPIYDKCKQDIATNHPDYSKSHIHNAALNRTSTFLAKHIFEYNKKENLP